MAVYHRKENSLNRSYYEIFCGLQADHELLKITHVFLQHKQKCTQVCNITFRVGSDDLWAEICHRSKRLDEGLHHQNSLKSVLEREGINSMACTVHEVYIYCMYMVVLLVEAGKRGSRLHSTHRVWKNQ